MLDFIYNHATEILGAILGTQALAMLIVNLTPTPRDDEIVGKLYRGIEMVAGIVTPKAKEVPPNRLPDVGLQVGPVQFGLDLDGK